MDEGVGQKHQSDSLPVLLQPEGVIGVSRLHISFAFVGPIICTLVYTSNAVRIQVVDARGGPTPFRAAITRPLSAFRRFGPLVCWDRLRAAAFDAPSCSTMTEDGVGYRHAILDWQGGMEALWSNPEWFVHRQQCELAQAYQTLMESAGLLLEQGTRVRIRTGLLAGLVSQVEHLERNEGRLRVVADLGGKGVAVDLAVSDIEFAPETTTEQNA